MCIERKNQIAKPDILGNIYFQRSINGSIRDNSLHVK